jgi:hypothetical protein
VKRKSPKQIKPIPKEAEARFYGIVLPYWHQKFSTTDDAWKSPNEDDRTSLQDVCELVFGDELELDLSDDSEAWKKVKFNYSDNNFTDTPLGHCVRMAVSQPTEDTSLPICPR